MEAVYDKIARMPDPFVFIFEDDVVVHPRARGKLRRAIEEAASRTVQALRDGRDWPDWSRMAGMWRMEMRGGVAVRGCVPIHTSRRCGMERPRGLSQISTRAAQPPSLLPGDDQPGLRGSGGGLTCRAVCRCAATAAAAARGGTARRATGAKSTTLQPSRGG
mmetsp:Transcript_23080/g.72543  ORF Transcript_23080/g.72543 Transcript_23080/m.72543 type:complete len:162 (+) Transcript_23080:76-561(+)